MGDSLAGRQFNFRLYPLDLKELYSNDSSIKPETELHRLMSVGGFPEPFLKNNRSFYNRWKKNHVDLILKQDLPYFESVREISQIETLLVLLRERVGSAISYQGLSEELNCDPKSIKKWLEILENLYVVFKIVPYSKNIARSILKEPKYYFYDTAQVEGGSGAQFENLVALSLLKEIHFREDVFGDTGQLFYLKNKEKKEIDFSVHLKGRPPKLIEVKMSDDSPSKNFGLFSKYFPKCDQIQLVLNLERNFSTPSGVQVVNAAQWLLALDLS
jgi:predicted AAA+ superfamily ATPase